MCIAFDEELPYRPNYSKPPDTLARNFCIHVVVFVFICLDNFCFITVRINSNIARHILLAVSYSVLWYHCSRS